MVFRARRGPLTPIARPRRPSHSSIYPSTSGPWSSTASARRGVPPPGPSSSGQAAGRPIRSATSFGPRPRLGCAWPGPPGPPPGLPTALISAPSSRTNGSLQCPRAPSVATRTPTATMSGAAHPFAPRPSRSAKTPCRHAWPGPAWLSPMTVCCSRTLPRSGPSSWTTATRALSGRAPPPPPRVERPSPAVERACASTTSQTSTTSVYRRWRRGCEAEVCEGHHRDLRTVLQRPH